MVSAKSWATALCAYGRGQGKRWTAKHRANHMMKLANCGMRFVLGIWSNAPVNLPKICLIQLGKSGPDQIFQ